MNRLPISLSFALVAAAVGRAQVQDGVIPGVAAQDRTGAALVAIGDVDKDGHPDFAAASASLAGLAIGVVRVHSGIDLHVIATINLNVPYSAVDLTLGGGTDVNKDGWPDLLVGMPYTLSSWNNTPIGSVNVYSGKDWSILAHLSGNILGQSPPGRFGYQVAGLGDVNDDGFGDFVLSEPSYLHGGLPVGRVVVVSGSTKGTLHQTLGKTAGGEFGASLAALGDLNGNGKADFAVGAPNQTEGGKVGAGWFGVFDGNGGTLFAVGGSVVNGALGDVVAAAGDANGDGKLDVAVHAKVANNVSNVTRVFPGPYGGAPILQFGGFGTRIAGAGDVNKDGKDDLLLADPGAPPANSGNAYVVSAVAGAILWHAIVGTSINDRLGHAVAPLGDRDGDGWLDFALGAPNYNGPTGTSTETGAVLVYRAVVQQPDEGLGGPGPARLAVYGTPLGLGGVADLKVTKAPKNAPIWLVASTQAVALPFKGGFLLPNPSAGLILPLVTDANGERLIAGIPGGAADAVVHVQAITLDPTLPQGFGLTNAVGVTISA